MMTDSNQKRKIARATHREHYIGHEYVSFTKTSYDCAMDFDISANHVHHYVYMYQKLLVTATRSNTSTIESPIKLYSGST
jgi:hypothetical protein